MGADPRAGAAARRPLGTGEQLADLVVRSGPPGGRDNGWSHAPGTPVAVVASVPVRDVRGQPAVRVLGAQPGAPEHQLCTWSGDDAGVPGTPVRHFLTQALLGSPLG